MVTISYKNLKRIAFFILGIAFAGVINYGFGTESTVLILGGVCGLLAWIEL